MIIGVNATVPFVTNVKAMLGAPWTSIMAIGRGATANTLTFIGQRTTGNADDIGTLDLATGIVTHIDNALSSTAGTNWGGIDCDRRTGIYVASTKTSFGNFYPSFWSTDLTTWTQVASPSTQFHGNWWITFDDTHELWYWQSGTSATGHFVSGDGKTFVDQQVFIQGFGVRGLNFSHPILRAEMNPLDSNVVLMPGGAQGFAPNRGPNVYRSDPTTYPEVPVYSTIDDTGNLREVVGPYLRVFTHSDAIDMGGNICAWNNAVYIMNDRGEIMKNDSTMSKNTWTQIAEKGTGNPANELIDLATTFEHLSVVDDVFWVNKRNTNQWYYYDGEPVGYGWTLDATGTGPFSYNGSNLRLSAWMSGTTETPLVFSGWQAGSDFRVYYTQ